MSNRRAFFQVVSPQHPNLLAGLGFENYRILKIDSCRNNAAVRAELNRLNIAVSGNEEHIRLIEINAHNPDPIARLDILDCQLEQARLNRLLDKAGDVALLRPATREVGAQGAIGFFRDEDGPTDIAHGLLLKDLKP